MALTTQTGLLAALPGQQGYTYKASDTSRKWGTQFYLNSAPSAGATPPAISLGGEIPTKATPGAIPFRNAGGGNTLYLYRVRAIAVSGPMGVWLCDRLWHASGVAGNITTSQSVSGPPALTRPDATGEGAELWLELATAFGGTATTMTASYTNSGGTPGRTATLALATNQAIQNGNMFPFTLQAGDTGVQSVQSVSLTPSTGTAGNGVLVIMRRLCAVPVYTSGVAVTEDEFGLALGKVDNDACLFGQTYISTNVNNPVSLTLQLVEG